MDLSTIKVDSARAEGGDWVGDIPGMGDLRLKVRGLGSMAYRLAVERRTRNVPRSQRRRDGTLPPDIADRISGEAAAEALLLDWDGLTSESKTMPFCRELAEKLLTDPDYRAFRDAVTYAAGIVAEEDRAFEETLLGSSARPSNGSSPGPSTPTS